MVSQMLSVFPGCYHIAHVPHYPVKVWICRRLALIINCGFQLQKNIRFSSFSRASLVGVGSSEQRKDVSSGSRFCDVKRCFLGLSFLDELLYGFRSTTENLKNIPKVPVRMF